MELKGTLSEGVLPGLLRDIYVGRRTGLLNFFRGGERRGVRFIGGNIVHADSNVRDGYLGEIMVRHGLLSREELSRASEIVARERRRLGAILLELSLVTQELLEDALELHVRDNLLKVFAWNEGAFEFLEQDADAIKGYDLTLKVSTGEMILEAVRRVSDPDVVRYNLGDVDRVLILSGDPLLRFQRINLTPVDGFILSRVDGVVTARDILKMAVMPVEEAQRSLFGLLCTGIVEYLARKPKDGASVLPSREEVLEAYKGFATRDHFEVLGIAPEAAEAEVKEAYFRLARRFHPDAHHDPSLADLRDELEAVFNRIGAASKVLSDPQRRAEYESGLLVARLAPEPGPQPEPAAGPPLPGPDAVRGAFAGEYVRELVERAEAGFSAGKYWDVMKSLQEEILTVAKGKLRQRARVLLAQCYLKNPKWKRMGEEELQEAIQEDPENAEAHFVLGKLYKEGRLTGRAAAMFRKALELKPRHAGALEELASLGPEPAPESPGLIRKLFK